MKRTNIFLSLIVVLFLLTRLLQTTQIPNSLYWDEASIGYNAYSVSFNGKEEWGKRFPIHFRAFGEFKLPVYIYTTAVFTKLFGLSEFVVRLPSIAYSLVTIIILYFLAKKISGERIIGLLSALMLTISPWFFIFSRTGYEATAGLMFFCLGVLLFFYKDKNRYLILVSVVSFILSMYSYNSYRLISPLVLGLLFLIYFKKIEFKKNLLVYFCSTFIFVLALIPIVRLFIFDSGFGRAQTFSLVPNIQQVYDLKGKPHLQIIYDRSKKTPTLEVWDGLLKNYFSHYSLDFLFINGDKNPRSHQPGWFGQLYQLDLLFFILGLFFVFRHPKDKTKEPYVIPILIVILSFVPPSLFKESPHALRSLSALPFLLIIVASGIYFSFQRLKKWSFTIPVLYLICFSFLLFNFFQNYNRSFAKEWQIGYKQIFQNYQQKFNDYQAIYVTDDFAQPYIYYLFYMRIKPEEFRRLVQYSPINNWGFSTVSQIGKFHFGIKDLNNLPQGKILIFSAVNETINKGSRIGQITDLKGDTLINVYEYTQI